jgi:hypothetical protein
VSLASQLSRLARSPQGRKMAGKAMKYANSPEGKARIAKARQALASKGRPKPR